MNSIGGRVDQKVGAVLHLRMANPRQAGQGDRRKEGKRDGAMLSIDAGTNGQDRQEDKMGDPYLAKSRPQQNRTHQFRA